MDLQIHEDEEVLYNKLNDKVNDLYGFVFALTDFVSPLIGSKIYDRVGMRREFDYIAVFNVMIGIWFFIFNCGPDFIRENDIFVEQLKEY